MKYFYLVLVFIFCLSAKAQTTAIPDGNFEQFLVDQGIDTNGLNGNILNTDAQAVTALNISVNTITDFTGLEAFTNLLTLDAGTNQFATLPLTSLTQLEELRFNQNMVLASLDLSANAELRIFEARANGGTNSAPITVIDLSNNLKSEEIDIYNFRNLQNVIFPNTDTVVDIYLLMHNDITVDFSGYSSLEYLALSTNFNNSFAINATLPSEQNVLKTVAFQGGNIINVDLSNFLALESITLQTTNTQTIDVPQTSTLTDIKISSHQIASVSFADADMLTNLTITGKNSAPGLQLDVTQNMALRTLNARSNYMTNIDLTNNVALESLNLASNQFTTFDVSQNVNLTSLNASSNNITNLDLTTNTKLNTLNLNYNKLPSIDLSTNIDLLNLYLAYNELPALDVTTHTKLSALIINNNLFTGTGLDLTQNPELQYFNAANNQIESLNITQNTKLGSLILNHNLFSGTDIMDQYYAIWNAKGALGASDVLDVSFNNLSGRIPDFASLTKDGRTNYFELNFDNNNFHFGDFENEHLSYVSFLTTYWTNIPSLPLFRDYTYALQAKVNEIENLTPTAGDDVILKTTVRGEQNHYKWFKDGVELTNAPDSPELILSNISDCDNGVYYSEITSDLVPFENADPPGTNGKNLLLTRNDITVNVSVTKTCVTLSNPLNLDTNVPINSGIEWENTTGACGYILNVGTTSGGTDIENNLDVGNVQIYNFQNDLPPNQDIYVTITPYFADGELTGCTEEMFTTSNTTAPPDCTELSIPVNNSTDVNVNTDLYWDAANGADEYTILVGTSSGADDILNDTVTDVFYDLPDGTLQSNTQYFVTIIPINSIGSTTGCTEVSFTTEIIITAPECVVLNNPADGATDVAISTDLSWDASAEATGYFLAVGTTSGGSDIVNNEDVGNITSYDLPNDLPENTQIFVTVTAYNTAGNASGCSETSFTTETLLTVPECVVLNNPADGVTDVAISTDLSWDASAEATGYRLTVGTTSGGTDIVNNEDVGNITSYDLPNDLPENTQIFVTVTAYNTAGNASGCTETSFTTETVITVPECVVLNNPADGATDVAIDTDLSWDASAEATGYFLTVGTTSGGSDIVNNEDVGNVTSYDLPNDLPENTQIFVTVTAYNSSGNASGCTETSFTTETLLTLPACTTIINPLDGDINVALEAVFNWTTVENADAYVVTVSRDSDQIDIYEETIVAGTSYSPSTGFPEGTTLYISVTPFNVLGSATGCEIVSFTTLTEVKETKYGISPNGDGRNDFWEIPGIEEFPDNVVKIYNRWGDLVFEATGYDNQSISFNGTANRKTGMGASQLPNGTYFFTIETAEESEFNDLKGFIVIRR